MLGLARRVGAHIAERPVKDDVTHVVTDEHVLVTPAVLQAVSRAIHVVPVQWLRDYASRTSPVAPVPRESKYLQLARHARLRPSTRRRRLFAGFCIAMLLDDYVADCVQKCGAFTLRCGSLSESEFVEKLTKASGNFRDRCFVCEPVDRGQHEKVRTTLRVCQCASHSTYLCARPCVFGVRVARHLQCDSGSN